MEQELNLLLVVGAPLDPVPSQEKLRQLLADARVVWGPKASRGTDQIIYKRFLGEVPNMEKAFADGKENPLWRRVSGGRGPCAQACCRA